MRRSAITSSETARRIERFGRHDHVRFYGDDVEDRLVEAGLAIRRLTPLALLGPEMVTWLRLSPDEAVWLVRPAADAAVPAYSPPAATALTSTLDAALQQLALQHGKLLRARERNEELAAENADSIKVAKLNVDDSPQTAAGYGISSIPTLMIFKGGQVVDRFVGVQPKSRLQDAIDQAKG